MGHIRQSRLDSGIGFQVPVPKTFEVVPFSLGSGLGDAYRLEENSRKPIEKSRTQALQRKSINFGGCTLSNDIPP